MRRADEVYGWLYWELTELNTPRSKYDYSIYMEYHSKIELIHSDHTWW